MTSMPSTVRQKGRVTMKTIQGIIGGLASLSMALQSCDPPDRQFTPSSTCVTVAPDADLHETLTDAEGCLSLSPGATYEVTETTYLSGVTEIRGNGAIISAENWGVPVDEPINTIFSMRFTTVPVVITDMTLDGANKAVYGIMGRDYTLERVTIVNGACSAIGIANTGVVVRDSIFIHNGWNCTIYTGLVYGGAVYAENQPSHSSNCYAPVITGTTITDSWGPALDINRVSCGTLLNNTIYENRGSVAVSLYESSDWTIIGNTIYHPITDEAADTEWHPYCAGNEAPIGAMSAAVKICRDTADFAADNNVIEGNHMASTYGVLILGADEVNSNFVPRNNTIKNNSLVGSVVACADDVRWPSRIMRLSLSNAITQAKALGLNVWSGNNCGNAKGLPIFF